MNNSENDVINVLLNDINFHRNKIIYHNSVILKIYSFFSSVFYIIFGVGFIKEINFVFLIAPLFLVSGLSLMTFQVKSIYLLTAHIKSIEDKINIYLNKECLEWERLIEDANSNKQIILINSFLYIILLFPLFLIYLYCLYSITACFSDAWFFLPIYLFYVLNLIIFIYILLFSKFRNCLDKSIRKK